MEAVLVQNKNKIALAHRRTIKTISPVKSNIQLFGITLELVTGQSINLHPLRIIQPLLARKQNEPMITRETDRPTFPNLPLVQIHRSGV